MILNLNLVVAIAVCTFLLYTAIELIKEKEYNGVIKAIVLSILIPIPFVFAWHSSFYLLSVAQLALFAVIVFILFIPLKYKKRVIDRNRIKRFDERDTMFSRNEIIPGSNQYVSYYNFRPENEITDKQFREKPGLLSDKSHYYHPYAFNSANASFKVVKELHQKVEGIPSKNKADLNPIKLSNYVKSWCKKLGALEVGIAPLDINNVYSVKGRGNGYGKKVSSSYPVAVAFTVEMNHEMVKAAPQASIVMESANQYLKSGRIAVTIAEFLRAIGYEARAHIDGNYELICPLVARDAGLGEIGRMGLLMTPTHGPRVRIGVVTTNAPLKLTNRKVDHSAEHFCLKCKKCATCCPGKAIPTTAPQLIENVKRWQINSESCFTYWTVAGTDCGRCMSVCPYSHPSNAFHNVMRWAIRNNYIFARLALIMDNFFYGKKPKPHAMPNWIACEATD